MTPEENELRMDVALASRVLVKRQLSHDIIGHVSARVTPGAKEMWIRCRASDEQGLARTKPEAVRRIDLRGEGDAGEGADLPLELPVHGAILDVRDDVAAVVHAHPPNAALCGVADVPLRRVFGAYDSPGMLLANDGIPVYPRSRLITTWELGLELADALGDKGACLLKGHGIVTVGASVGEAMLRAIHLERLCAFAWQLQLAGKAGSVPEILDVDLEYFTDPHRRYISHNTEWRWRSYRAEVEDGC